MRGLRNIGDGVEGDREIGLGVAEVGRAMEHWEVRREGGGRIGRSVVWIRLVKLRLRPCAH